MSTPNRERFGRPWTQAEDELLLENDTPSKRAELSQLLDRTASAIQVRWVRLRKRQRAKKIANVIERDQAAQQNLPLIPVPPTPTRRRRRPSVIRRLDNRKPGSHYSDEVRRKALAIAAQGVAPGIVDRTLRIGKGCTRAWMNEAGQKGKPPPKPQPAPPPSLPSTAATASTPTPLPLQSLLSLTEVDTTVQAGREGASVMAINGIADIELVLSSDGPLLHVRLR